MGFEAWFTLASLLTELITNVAAATVILPLALALGTPLGVSSHALAVAVAIGASSAFATPIGYQTNTIVAGAAGYRCRDFLRVGVPLKVLTSLVAIACIATFWRS